MLSSPRLVGIALLALTTTTGNAGDHQPGAGRRDQVPPPRPDGRLPGGVRPTAYALDLVVDPSTTRFSGKAHIDVAIERPTHGIVMHGRGFAIKSATVRVGKNSFTARTELRRAAGSKSEPEELTLSFDRPLPAGPAEIEIAYEAPFSPRLEGFYRVDDNGASYAYTDFEPNDARRAFPCFDEPGWKTPFSIALTVPTGSLAVANMPETRRTPGAAPGTTRFEFERSPPLPTYLVAFAVGRFEILEGAAKPVPVRVIALPGKSALGRLAVDAAAAHLDLLAKYFARPYPYPKLDLVAVPNFGSGAMENAGLVTFREELLLLDSERASTVARRAMASVVAHELAHQWFGDLVTMVWWDDVWLNEAFATWMADKIVDQWRPATRAHLYALAKKSDVMGEDALATARRIRNPVRNTSEAREAFDPITYAKGRAVLAMIESWLGEDTFRAGMRRYVEKHAFGNATAADLYAALGEASGGRPVAKVMESFTTEIGVPLVSAETACETLAAETGAGAGAGVRLTQTEYRTLERPRSGDNGKGEKLWHIPVCVLHAEKRGLGKTCALLEEKSARIDVGGGACPKFVYANAAEAGYYRMALHEDDLARLRGIRDLSDSERFGIVANAWAAVLAGELPATRYLDFLAGLPRETGPLVWMAAVDSLHFIDRALVSDDARPGFAKFVRALLGPVARRIGWGAEVKGGARSREPDDIKLLRESVWLALGKLGDDPAALTQATRLARTWLVDPNAISRDAARVAIPLAARNGDAALHAQLLEAFRRPATPEIHLIALSGLTGFDEPSLVERTLALALDPTVKAQDLRYMFGPFASRRATRDVMFAWVDKHFDEVANVLPVTLIGKFTRLVGNLCDEAKVRALETSLRPRVAKMEGAEKDLRQGIEEAMRCAALATKERTAASARLMAAR